MLVRAAATPGDLARLRAFVADVDTEASAALDRHLARARYRPALTRIAEQAGAVLGYALIGHARLRLGAATLETGQIGALYVLPDQRDAGVFEMLVGDCLRALAEEGLSLVTIRGLAEGYAPFGFAEYSFDGMVELRAGGPRRDDPLRPAMPDDLDDLAAIYAACYDAQPLAEARAAPDWRAWLAGDHHALALEDTRRRVVAYAAVAHTHAWGALEIAEAAAADAGVARDLCAALLGHAAARRADAVRLCIPPWHRVAQAALHLGGTAQIKATHTRTADVPLAGVVDLPALLDALRPEFERRLAGSRYAGWSGNLRIEIETERVTLALEGGRATVIDGSRPADLRLRQVTLPALAQICLGYRAAADLRATGGLACDDSTLGLLDALFPTVMCGG